MTSSPPYPHRHSGPVLVCGNAWCLDEDIARARALRPDAAVIAVNGAAGAVPAFALFSHHPEKLPKWITAQSLRFGPCFTVHSSGAIEPTKLGRNRGAMPWVDHWWPGARGGGTSAWCAVKLAKLMGFEEVVLCGAPLTTGSYSDGRMARDFNRPEILGHYRAQIARDTDWHAGVTSMSGWTREFFGEPTLAPPEASPRRA